MRYPKYEQLRRKVNHLGYTHQELADAIAYSRPYVTATLNGRRAPRCLAAIEDQVAQWQAQECRR